MNLEFKRCFLCKGNSLQIKYFYHNQNINSESNEYFDKKNNIYSCEKCKISYCDDVSTENLNKYYETLDKKVPKFHIINSKNLIQDFLVRFYTL